SDADAAFGLGFCHGQDRAAQLEVLWRVGRGRLAEWVGPAGLPSDRMSRRIGFRRAAEKQFFVLPAAQTEFVAAFVAGINAGHSVGLQKKPHEFALVGGEPSPWDAADVLAVMQLQSFVLPSNWDVELARLRLLKSDGPEAVKALDPVPGERGVSTPRLNPAEHWGVDTPRSPRIAELAADLAALQAVLPRGGGSNNWVIAGSRTATGKPILASDPHLSPTAPPPWYLAHVRTPDWEILGANLAGTPAFPIGHNGSAAWGVTAGLTDNTDLFLETVRPDECQCVTEVIRVKGQPDVKEEVFITPRGPILTPILDDLTESLSLRAVWLDPLPLGGFVCNMRAKTFDEFRRPFAAWPALPLNVLYADAGGTIGWQLVGQVPQRLGGNGTLPTPASSPGWAAEHVPFDAMPFTVNPECGYLGTANNPPASVSPWLGADFVDDYRARVILEVLGKRTDWDADGCRLLQLDTRSIPWEEMRDTVLSLAPTDPDGRDGLKLLARWDGNVTIDSAAAAVFQLLVAEMCVRVAKAKAPHGWRAALGETGLGQTGGNLFTDRRVGHLSRLLRQQPDGWFARPWADEIADALAGVVRTLRQKHGPGPAFWGWGHLRQLRLEHPLFKDKRFLGKVFNLGPVPIAGDMNTVSQAGCRPLEPLDFTHNMANMRCVFDLADLPKSTFVLCGGQSGNPWSPHHADQFPLWQAGETINPPFDQTRVIRECKKVLRLMPG
ncbi:MAG TPA: penicillin acylase family protein, partial [Gemmataceae bacterium]|nr:penicillin acylase family protein [Gemmataceae bacterium]